ncbi:MAG: lipocalin-like domain-containing protein [Proteobacteria bacterium]|nr:lipocalin-like domain-containing protein [Pseudomonadota bacterium]
MVSAEDIIGTWLLIDRGASADQQAALLERYGEDSQGVVILSPEGWLCAALGRGDRARLPGDPDWHADAPDAARLAAFDSYVSYAGTWRIEDGRLITKVVFALNPSWVGGEQVRDVELRADGTMRLIVTRTWPNGEDVSVWVDWRRAD